MRVEIALRVDFETPFSVGTGAMAGITVDKHPYRDALNRPVIPGSSLKGRARHSCEAILRTLTGDENSACHSPRAETMCPQDPRRDTMDYCPVCQIFGGPSRGAAFTFSDLQWELADHWETLAPPTDIRNGVSIRRTRRVSEPNRLHKTETFAPAQETRYDGQISGHLPDEEATRYALAALLAVGLKNIRSLGGSRSRGLGRCKVSVEVEEMVEGELNLISDGQLREGLSTWSE